MIERHWRGLAKPRYADLYVDHLRGDTIPGLRSITGFVAISILRRTVPEGIEFVVATRWRSTESIERFAGQDPREAVVPEQVRRMMIEYDRAVRHYDVVQ